MRPSSLFEATDASYLWSTSTVLKATEEDTSTALKATQQAAQEDASRFRQLYEEDVQFIFSRVQHHWHKLDDKGNRYAMQYCQLKGRRCKGICKAGHSKESIRDEKNKLVLQKYRAHVVFKGVAAELDLNQRPPEHVGCSVW